MAPAKLQDIESEGGYINVTESTCQRSSFCPVPTLRLKKMGRPQR